MNTNLLGDRCGWVTPVCRCSQASKIKPASICRPTTPGCPANARLLPLPPYSPELNPVEKLGDVVKDRICHRIYLSLRRLEDHILATWRPWRTDATRVAELIDRRWLLDAVNAGAPA